MADQEAQVRPFCNGSQYGDWRDRNCFRCVKSYERMEPKPTDGMGPCEIDNAVGLAYIGSGSVTPAIAKRMGWNHDKPFYGWDCPERELVPEKPKETAQDLGTLVVHPPCDHAVPAFGCESCITKGREGFAREAYLAWKKTYRLPACEDCGSTLAHEGFTHTPTEVRAILACKKRDCDGDMGVVIA